jgi:hypothetical protein
VFRFYKLFGVLAVDFFVLTFPSLLVFCADVFKQTTSAQLGAATATILLLLIQAWYKRFFG